MNNKSQLVESKHPKKKKPKKEEGTWKKTAVKFLNWIKVWEILKKFEESLRKKGETLIFSDEDLRENPLNKDLGL